MLLTQELINQGYTPRGPQGQNLMDFMSIVRFESDDGSLQIYLDRSDPFDRLKDQDGDPVVVYFSLPGSYMQDPKGNRV